MRKESRHLAAMTLAFVATLFAGILSAQEAQEARSNEWDDIIISWSRSTDAAAVKAAERAGGKRLVDAVVRRKPYAERLQTREKKQYLGFKIGKLFQTCRGEMVSIGDGTVVATEQRCPEDSPLAIRFGGGTVASVEPWGSKGETAVLGLKIDYKVANPHITKIYVACAEEVPCQDQWKVGDKLGLAALADAEGKFVEADGGIRALTWTAQAPTLSK